jgi:hypothetical protein
LPGVPFLPIPGYSARDMLPLLRKIQQDPLGSLMKAFRPHGGLPMWVNQVKKGFFGEGLQDVTCATTSTPFNAM